MAHLDGPSRCTACGAVVSRYGAHVCSGYDPHKERELWREHTQWMRDAGEYHDSRTRARTDTLLRERYKKMKEEEAEMGTKMGYLTVLAVRHSLDEARLREINEIISQPDWRERVLLLGLVINPDVDMVALGYTEPGGE